MGDSIFLALTVQAKLPFPPTPPPSDENTNGLLNGDFAKAEEQWAKW